MRERVVLDKTGVIRVWLRVREPAEIWNKVAVKVSEIEVSKNAKYSNEQAASVLDVMVKRGREQRC